jgi:hypothetical protein
MSKLGKQNVIVPFKEEQEVTNPMHNAPNPNDINGDASVQNPNPTAIDDAIKNCEKITAAMHFNSEGAAEAFKSIKSILQNEETSNEDKKIEIANKSETIKDTALQVFANIAIAILGSSKEKDVDQNIVDTGIKKLSGLFAFLEETIDDKDEKKKDERLQNVATDCFSLLSEIEDKDTKNSILTAIGNIIDINKIVSTEDSRDSSSYDGKNWEDYKSKAILCSKGAIAIGLLFAPGGIILAGLFLLATKDFGCNSDEIDEPNDEKELLRIEKLKTLVKNFLENDNTNTNNNNNTNTTAIGHEVKKFFQTEAEDLEEANKSLQTNEQVFDRMSSNQKDSRAEEDFKNEVNGVLKVLQEGVNKSNGVTTDDEAKLKPLKEVVPTR